ncbi:Unknown protein [Striga hermonthica]|uniref:Uncharacterized protein n=1 Tax=Striga hermonthica TaxID=68872 RepID=A0A9N7MMD7_STRHE|nr:Unknown protein [Striga hermonthica]
MVVSLNSANIFSPTVNYQPTTRPYIRVLLLKVHSVSSLSPPVKLNVKISRIHHRLAVGGDNIPTETTEKDSKPVQGLNSNDEPSSNVAPNIKENRIMQYNEASQSSNGPVYPDPSLSAPNPSLTSKRAPLTARERLRAARVLNRYNDSKPTKTGLRSNFLEALRNSDNEGNRKRSGLPEAPSNLFDDSKRGLPKEGWTINLPGERSGRANNEQGSCTNRTSKQRSGRECIRGAKKCRLRGTRASTHHTADWSSPVTTGGATNLSSERRGVHGRRCDRLENFDMEGTDRICVTEPPSSSVPAPLASLPPWNFAKKAALSSSTSGQPRLGGHEPTHQKQRPTQWDSIRPEKSSTLVSSIASPPSSPRYFVFCIRKACEKIGLIGKGVTDGFSWDNNL